jgi:hypothetical protein
VACAPEREAKHMTNVELLKLAIRMRYGATITLNNIKTLDNVSKETLIEIVKSMAFGVTTISDAVIDHLQETDHIPNSEIKMRVEAFHREAVVAVDRMVAEAKK